MFDLYVRDKQLCIGIWIFQEELSVDCDIDVRLCDVCVVLCRARVRKVKQRHPCPLQMLT